MTGTLMEQIRSLRARAIIERIVNHGDRGAFLQAGNSCERVLRSAGWEREIASKAPGCLSQADVDQVLHLDTDIGKVPEETFERVFRHGFDVAD